MKVSAKLVGQPEKFEKDGKVYPNLAYLTFIPDRKFSKWENIDSWIKWLITYKPDEVKGILELVKAERKMQFNKFAATKDLSMRRTVVLPTEIMLAIKKWYPEIFKEKKQMDMLMRKFKGFTVAEKV